MMKTPLIRTPVLAVPFLLDFLILWVACAGTQDAADNHLKELDGGAAAPPLSESVTRGIDSGAVKVFGGSSHSAPDDTSASSSSDGYPDGMIPMSAHEAIIVVSIGLSSGVGTGLLIGVVRWNLRRRERATQKFRHKEVQIAVDTDLTSATSEEDGGGHVSSVPRLYNRHLITRSPTRRQ